MSGARHSAAWVRKPARASDTRTHRVDAHVDDAALVRLQPAPLDRAVGTELKHEHRTGRRRERLRGRDRRRERLCRRARARVRRLRVERRQAAAGCRGCTHEKPRVRDGTRDVRSGWQERVELRDAPRVPEQWLHDRTRLRRSGARRRSVRHGARKGRLSGGLQHGVGRRCLRRSGCASIAVLNARGKPLEPPQGWRADFSISARLRTTTPRNKGPRPSSAVLERCNSRHARPWATCRALPRRSSANSSACRADTLWPRPPTRRSGASSKTTGAFRAAAGAC